MTEQTKRAAYYGRVSTAEQVEGTSLDTQRERCLKAIADHDDWELAGEYVDEGVSGAKGSRPQLDRLMADCRAGSVGAVVVSKLDRFGRSVKHLSNLIGELDERSVFFVSVAESFDSSTPAGRLMRNTLGSFAEFERDIISDRTQSGLLSVAKAGYWRGGPPPFGFQLDKNPDGSGHTRLALDPDESATIRTAVAEILGGRSVYDTAKLFNELGHERRSRQPWSYNGLRRLLLEAQISGTWTYGRPKTWGRGLSDGQFTVPIVRIITPEEHAQLRAILTGKSWTRAERVRFFLLSRGVLVSECGLNRYGKHRKSRDTYAYMCMGNPHNGGPGPKGKSCECRPIPGAWLDAVVWAEVHRLFADPDHLVALADEYVQRQNQAEAPDDLVAIERTVAELEAKRTKIGVEKLREGVPADLVKAAVAEIDGELVGLAARAKRAKTAAEQKGQARGRLPQLRAMAARASERLDRMTDRERRVVLDALELRVEVLGWSPCDTCKGKGKLTGGTGGLPCPGCGMAKEVPHLRISGIWTSDLGDERGSRVQCGGDAPHTGADVRAEPFPATLGSAFGSLLMSVRRGRLEGGGYKCLRRREGAQSGTTGYPLHACFWPKSAMGTTVASWSPARLWRRRPPRTEGPVRMTG